MTYEKVFKSGKRYKNEMIGKKINVKCFYEKKNITQVTKYNYRITFKKYRIKNYCRNYCCILIFL